MKKTTTKFSTASPRRDAAARAILPALFAVSGSLAALPASALELGEAAVESTLGQPLRASIAFALGPNESLNDSCVSLQQGTSANGLPNVSRASVNVADGIIAIRGNSVVREPLLSMRVNVHCPYTPRLSREYMLFVDPAKPVTATATPVAAETAADRPNADRRSTANPVRRPAVAPRSAASAAATPIANASRYRVQPGESLSEIAQRIEDRPVGLWPAVNAIFDANPDAFIDNDPNKLKAGSWLNITDLGAGKALMVADRTVAPVAPARASSPAVVNTAPATAVDTTADAAPAEPVTATGNENTSDLKPGDVLLDSDNPFVTPIGSDANTIVDIPDTELEGPRTNAGSPNVPTATIQAPTAAEPAGNNALFWLAGGGIGLIAALLLFGFRRKPRFDDVPLDPAVVPKRRQTDTGEVPAMTDFEAELSGEFPAKIAEDPGIEVTHEMESHLSDDCPTEENLALDADLVIGTGLQEGASVDVAQDFGFAATTDLDLELPEEMSSGGPETRQTDIIPPLNIDTESILESEVLPDENDDDYDMSVIVDATQMPDPEDVTERDLEAVAVDTGDDDLITGDYTVSQEVDYKILEQDYEDEMTATQALNKEIARAAQELAERMDENADDTSQMTIASVTHVDVAAENDDLGDAPTVNMTDEKTIEMVPEDETIEMPSDDRTVEMPARRGKTGTKGR